MSKLKFGLLAIAASFMFQGAAVQPASALPSQKPTIAAKSDVTLAGRRHHHHRFHGGGFRRHGFYGGHGFHRRHYYRPRFYVAPVYGYNSGCRWMKRKALYTGSSYWWRRYQHCRRGW